MGDGDRPEIGALVDAGGIKTNYLEAGEGPPVVLVHGSGPGVTAYANWRLTIPGLSPHFHVFAPDMAGFGYTERPEGVAYNMDTWVDQIIGFFDALDLGRTNLVGNSGPMRQVQEQLQQVAPSATTVLLRGESGTGKELLAHEIHYNSPRARRPFIKVSCAALPESLIESELFGYEKGAFTGAHARKKGRFELAEGGTLFLDEIGDVHLPTQVKLLRVLQEREFERLGGTDTIKVNVRLIAATNKDVEQAIAQETFREDLFYRLNVFTIFVPPLRERKPDVLLLADYFLERFAAEHGRTIKRISTPAIDMLTVYHWPGNARELQNVIERAVLVCDGQVIHAHHLPPTLQTAEASGTVTDLSLVESVDAYEKDLILDALKTSRGNRTKAARLLHSTERIISYKVRKYRIDCRRFRS